MGVLQNSNAIATAGSSAFYEHEINHSVRFEEDAGDKLSRTPSSGGNRRTFTVSFWLKRTAISHSGNHMVIFGADARDGGANMFQLRINNSDAVQFAGNGAEIIYTPLFRDTTGWGNFVFTVDTTQATASNRFKFYFNGTQITDTTYNTISSQNTETAVNQSGVIQDIGVLGYGSNTTDFAGYLAEFVLIDGTAYDASYFGEFKGGNIWIPKDPSGLTFGTNGVHFTFSNASSLGADSSSNGNNYSATNLPVNAQTLDSPTFGS